MNDWLIRFTEYAVMLIDTVALVVIVGATIQAVIGMLQLLVRPAGDRSGGTCGAGTRAG